MPSRPFGIPSFQWVFYLTTGLLFGATGLRSLLVYANDTPLPQALGLVLLSLLLFILSETWVAARWSAVFPLYVLSQTAVILAMLFLPGSPDFFALLFGILSMQVMQRWSSLTGTLCIGLLAPLITVPLVMIFGVTNGIAFALLFTFLNALLGNYALAARRAYAARARNESLAAQVAQANRQLQTYARQAEQLAIERERHRLARELHDSVTQTIFSMTLCTQSALLLLDHDPARVGAQLERLNSLAQNAVSEMRVLVSDWRPETTPEGGLVAALRRHLTSRAIPEGLAIALEIDGDGALALAEEQSLFRIAQEALNNIVKHARTAQACVRLHLSEPFWMEIADQGCGFRLSPETPASGLGLSNMRERAAEIGWHLDIETAPGAGTCIRVEKEVTHG